jgi:hypothetical protein
MAWSIIAMWGSKALAFARAFRRIILLFDHVSERLQECLECGGQLRVIIDGENA